MWTYQVRKRTFRIPDGSSIEFPNSADLEFELIPLQQFGAGFDRSRTATRGVAAQAQFDAMTGKHWIESETQLEPLDLTIEDGTDRTAKLNGNTLHITQQFEDGEVLQAFVESLYLGLPIVLNVEFYDPPVVNRVRGKIGETPFRWELSEWYLPYDVTTTSRQETRFANCWSWLPTLSQPENRRLIAALHYFHIACRLERAGNSPWEFMGEVILNLSKSLEALFPGTEGKTLDAARSGLSSIGITEEDAERYFIPAMALRNSIDSGHVLLSIFTRSQLTVIHSYTEGAIRSFRNLFTLIMEKAVAGEFVPEPYMDLSPGDQAINTIERIAPHIIEAASRRVPFQFEPAVDSS
jgi:hypothetical protein